MKNKYHLISAITAISLAMLACGVSFNLDATDESKPIAQPSSMPRPTSTKSRPTPTEQSTPTQVVTHQLYAGFTGDRDIPFLIIHPEGETLGISENATSSTMTGIIYSSSSGDSFVVYTDNQGLPDTAVVEDEFFLFSNYTSTTVDVTIVHPGGQRESVRVKLDIDTLDKINALKLSQYDLASSLSAHLGKPRPQNVLEYMKEGLFALDIASCASKAAVYATAATISANPLFLLPIIPACDGPILEEVIRERRASNLDVGNLEKLATFIDVISCPFDWTDCVSFVVSEMEKQQEQADIKYSNMPSEPEKKKKYK